MTMDRLPRCGWIICVLAAGCGRGSLSETAERSSQEQAPATRPLAEANVDAVAESPLSDSAVVPASHVEPLPSLDLSWIGEEHFAAILVHPQRIHELSPPGSELRTWLDAAAGDLGVRLSELEQLCFLLGPPDPAMRKEFASPVTSAWIFRFRTPAAQQAMLRSFLGDHYAPQSDAQGRVYFKSESTPVAICTPDETTVLMAPERTVRKSLAARHGRSPLLSRLAAVTGRPDVVASVDVAPLRPLLRQMAAGGANDSPPPPWIRQVSDAAHHLKEGTLTIELSGDPLARLTMEAENSQSAVRLEEMAQGYRGTASLMLTAMQGAWLRGEGGQSYAPLFKLAGETLAGVRTRREVRQVTVEAPPPAGLANLGPILNSALVAARRGAARQERVRRLQLVGLALHDHHVQRGAFPPAASRDAAGRPLLSWRVHLLPSLGEEELYRQFRLEEPWNSPHNRALLPQIPMVYQSPDAEIDGRTRIVALVGPGVPFGEPRGAKLRDFTDGPSETILLVECGPDRAIPWTQPDDLAFDPQDPAAALGAVEPDGFLALFGDGRVEAIRTAIAPAALRALLTHAGGEAASPPK